MGKKRHRHWRDPLRHCEMCGRILRRRRDKSERLEGLRRFRARRTCSESCRRASLQVGQPAYNRRVEGVRAPSRAEAPPPPSRE